MSTTPSRRKGAAKQPGTRKGAAKQRAPQPKAAAKSTARRRRGLPAPESVEAVIPFTSPKGQKFRILRTNEADSYDPPSAPPGRRAGRERRPRRRP